MAGVINLEGKDVLVVEDDDMNFIYMRQIFKLTKGNITRAINGAEALEKARKNSYDLILMDIQLPDISGAEITKQIRTFNAEVPIIAQTASRTPDETDVCLESGCTDILFKPFTINDFSGIVKKYI